ncbi:MAG: hypothetical protein EOM26_05715 [Alphaproteobacteria bacterium]|nr:hypothetical protein [Alphaproteobacteria bacterium]
MTDSLQSGDPRAGAKAQNGKGSMGPMVQQLMMNPGNFMQLLGLFFLAFTNPEALRNGGLEKGLANLLGFDNPDAMNQWRENAGGNFLKSLKTAHWDRIDESRVQQEYHKYAHLADSGNPLLELIGEHESAGDYNRAYGRGIVRPEIGGKSVTECTIAEVRQWQRDYVASGSASSAVGKYQIIQKTMDGLVNELAAEDGVSRQEFMASNLFDAAMQDRMAVKLLERRGFAKYIDGQMSERDFMRGLSQEWASLPKDGSGVSYYAGDGLNAAGARPEEVLGAMRASRDRPKEEVHIAANSEGDNRLTANFARADAADKPLAAPAEPDSRNGLPGSWDIAQAATTPLEKPVIPDPSPVPTLSPQEPALLSPASPAALA